MLNYPAMKNPLRNLYLILLLILAMTTACSAPPEESNSNAANSNVADSDAAQPADGAQNGTSPATSEIGPAGAAPGDQAADPKNGPKLVVPVKRIDFGRQPELKEITRNITVKNEGKKKLKIEAVQPGCGCTTVDFPKTIAPGKSGEIKVKVNFGTVPGEHVKTVSIKSNDPVQPEFIVELVFVTRKTGK